MGRILLRRLKIASLFGAVWSYWYGGSVVLYFLSVILPWLWNWFAYGACHYVLIFLKAAPPAAMVSFWNYLLAPNWVFGLIWVCYYIYSFFYATPIDYFPVGGATEYQFHVFATGNKRNPPAHSTAWEGEQKQKLVEACYTAYRQALARFDPPPVTNLKTPGTFFHRPGNKLEWQITSDFAYYPTLPQEMLNPDGLHNLMPLLAQHLYWYQTLDTHTLYQRWRNYPDQDGCLWAITGNGTWLPALIKSKSVAAMKKWLVNEVFAADRFAYWLGQGPGLLHLLRYFEAELKRRGQPDQTVPTLASRIGQLEALVTKEEEKMRALGLHIQEQPAYLPPAESLPVQLLPAAEADPSQQSTFKPFWHNI